MRKLRLAGRAVRNRARSRRQQRPPDKGFTLVEIVMTITITAIVLVPTMDAVIATIRAGTSNTNFSDVETVLQNAADRVNRAPKGCDYTQYAQAAAQTNGWSASTTNVLQQHYVPGSSSTVLGSWAASACDAAVTTPPDLAVQLVTITVTSPDGKFQKTLQVVKSDV
jgi:prepilin-type N-terminal cleavage/methylation domain-containing protein